MRFIEKWNLCLRRESSAEMADAVPNHFYAVLGYYDNKVIVVCATLYVYTIYISLDSPIVICLSIRNIILL